MRIMLSSTFHCAAYDTVKYEAILVAYCCNDSILHVGLLGFGALSVIVFQNVVFQKRNLSPSSGGRAHRNFSEFPCSVSSWTVDDVQMKSYHIN